LFIIISIAFFHPNERLGTIQIFCLVTAIMAVFGVVAGWLLRLFRSNKSKAKIILIAIGGLMLLAPFLFIGYMFTGAPLHSMPVNKIVREYVDETYAGFDIVVGRTWYNWYSGKYVTKIHDRNDADIYFEIWYITKTSSYNPTHIIDRYRYGYFWEQTFKKMITPLLEQEFGDELISFYTVVGGVKTGQPFDKDAPISIQGNFSVTAQDTEPEALAAEFVKYRDFIEKNDFTFTSYLFRFRRTDGRSSIHITLQAEHINDDLAGLIDYMQNNLNEDGRYYGGKRGLHYRDWSFMDR
jgi:hypothetical protein